MNDIILYTSEDGKTRLDLRIEGETIWLTQLEIAELFQTTKQNVSLHAKNILDEGELLVDSVVKDSLTTASDGKNYRTKLYNLDLILAIGYRIRSPRGTQFRQWATTHLKEYLLKGFVMDDERLKEPSGWDYFDELLARIRDIRASEKRFYQKVRDLFALSSDYQQREQDTQLFFAQAQNKLLFAVTEHTAAELVVARADANEPNMALTAWKGSRVRKHDVTIAKNYLSRDEIDTLNRLVVIFLEQAELRVKNRQDLTLSFWQDNLDSMLAFSDQPILQGAGNLSTDAMKEIVHDRYDSFDQKRKQEEALQADAEEMQALEALEKQLTGKVDDK
ncbi:virulence RhuM family protein [Reinekea thalattae]|uniref:Virulence RhuM family protein n=1 Tax=Reinekea thalattae TaxID=2593301 RepID=A0A5C8Z389_9GAMM|nr:virulence RhuM family protein [Reinekea thalattae]TXR52017.1 virulence RhuM family protein [Reinekea thalattae]